MADGLMTFLAGLAGSVFVPIAVYFGQQGATKAHAVADLLREFNDPEMSKARREARVILRRSSSPTDTEAEPLYVIARFYHRLNALREANTLKDKLLFTLFAQEFAYWWGLHFERQSPKSRTNRDVQMLKGYFDREANATSKRSKWEGWQADGRRHRLE